MYRCNNFQKYVFFEDYFKWKAFIEVTTFILIWKGVLALEYGSRKHKSLTFISLYVISIWFDIP